jgi:hypothetical protein
MAVEELLKHVHPDAVYRRQPLPDDQNALGPWREAVKAFVPPDRDDPLWGSLIYGEDGKSVAFPAGAEGERLRMWLDRNRSALDLLEAGIQRGRLQLPERHGNDVVDLDTDVARHVVPLGQLFFVRAKCFHADGNAAEECRFLLEMLRMGEMICNGDGVVVHYLMGQWCRKSALNRIRMLANGSDTPVPVLRALLAAIEQSLAAPDGLSQSLRADFYYWALQKLDALADRGNLDELVDKLLETFYSRVYTFFDASNEPQVATPSDGRLAWRREQIVSLLRGHPRPFDKIATVRHMGKLVAALIRSMDYTQRSRIFDLSYRLHYLLFSVHWRWCRRQPRGMRYWPAQLKPSFGVNCLGDSDDARAKLAEYHECLGAKWLAASQPPTEADVAQFRRKLRRVRNPVGWLLAAELMPTDILPFAWEYREALERIRTLPMKRLNAGS